LGRFTHGGCEPALGLRSGQVRRRQPRVCSSCGSGLSRGARFCSGCGQPTVRRLAPPLLAAGWVAVGLLVAVTLLAAISLPPVALVTALPAVLLGRALDRRGGGEGSTRWAAAAGVAALPLLLAYLNRHGPGTWCHPIGTPQYPGQECADQWDPRPFLAIGLALLLAPAVVIALAARRRQD
jgi:hypothetical protein